MTTYSKVTRGHAHRILVAVNRIAVDAGESYGLPLADLPTLERMTEAVCARLVSYCPDRGRQTTTLSGEPS